MRDTKIPQRSRDAVSKRSMDRCERCGGAGYEAHHRMRRREGGHDPRNLVLLCGTCHRWVHANPDMAKKTGFIVEPWYGKENIHLRPIEVSGVGVVLLGDTFYEPFNRGER